jgi:hypothetical protein
MLRRRYRFLSPFTPLLLLLNLLTLSFRRERLERHLLHIIWFADRNDRRNFGGFLLFVNKMETYISLVIAWQNIMFYNILYVSICAKIFNTIKMTTLQDANIFLNAYIYQRSFSR